MSTKREQILAALFTKLQAISPAPAGGVHRSRVGAFSRAESPAIALEPVSDNADSSVIPMLDWSLLVRIAVIVRGVTPDQVADPFAEKIHEQVCEDLSLGGLCFDIQPVSVNFELLEGDKPIGVISLGYRIQYRTSATDLTI